MSMFHSTVSRFARPDWCSSHSRETSRGVEQAVGCSFAGRQQIPAPVAQRSAQPGVDRHAEAHLRPLDQRARDVAVEHPAQEPLALAAAASCAAAGARRTRRPDDRGAARAPRGHRHARRGRPSPGCRRAGRSRVSRYIIRSAGSGRRVGEPGSGDDARFRSAPGTRPSARASWRRGGCRSSSAAGRATPRELVHLVAELPAAAARRR